MPPTARDLPFVDEHTAEVSASPQVVWDSLLHVVEASFGSSTTSRIARLLDCSEVAASGPRPLAAGSTIPGFRVETAERPRELSLRGGHRFSDYALTFRLDDPENEQIRLRAETRAVFPGLKGAVYRTLVIRTRGHVLVTRRLLDAIRRRAER